MEADLRNDIISFHSADFFLFQGARYYSDLLAFPEGPDKLPVIDFFSRGNKTNVASIITRAFSFQRKPMFAVLTL